MLILNISLDVGNDSESESGDSYLATALAWFGEWDERACWCTYVFGVYNYVSSVGVYNYGSGVGVYMLVHVWMCLMFAFCIEFVWF